MVKLILAKWIKSIHGTLKNKLSFRYTFYRQVLEAKPHPIQPNTQDQQKVKLAFKQAKDEWLALSPEEKEKWKKKGYRFNLTGYQTYLKYRIKEILAVVFDYAITIDNSQNSNTLQDYQVLLQINNDPQFFADVENPMYLEFYDEDETTLLKHYVEEWDNINNNARIWIKIPLIPASSIKTIYLKINTSRTVDLSDPKSVFVDWYDDFEAYSLGNLVGQGNWMQDDDRTSCLVVDNPTYEGVRAVKCDADHRAAKHSLPLTTNFKLILRWRLDDRGYSTSSDARLSLKVNGTTIFEMGHRDNTKTTFYYRYAGTRYWTSKTINLEQWYTFKITCDPNENLKWYVNNELLASVDEHSIDEIAPYADEGCIMYMDQIMLAKYNYPEPSVSYSKL